MPGTPGTPRTNGMPGTPGTAAGRRSALPPWRRIAHRSRCDDPVAQPPGDLPMNLPRPVVSAVLAALLVLAGCATQRPAPAQPGQTEAQVLQQLGQPTGRYAMEGGVQRLEYATGPFGRTTWMVDIGRDGRVVAAEQVLTERYFAQVVPGMTQQQVLRLLGRPADMAGEYRGRRTWSWRFETNDCLWVRVTFGPEGEVIGGAATMFDPRCDIRH
jgi:hypothetical protein